MTPLTLWVEVGRATLRNIALKYLKVSFECIYTHLACIHFMGQNLWDIWVN